MNLRPSRLATFVLPLVLAGCGGGEESIDTGASATPDAFVDPLIDAHEPSTDAASAEATRTTIGAAGGVARSADGLFELHVAPGALTEDTELAISVVPPSEVPADIAATSPLTPVYSLEPDGLVFAGDGAIARFTFDSVPPALVEGDSHAALLGATRSAAAGPIEDEAGSTTVYTAAGGVVAHVPVTHLSFKWAFARSNAGDRFSVGTVLGAPRQEVGDSWAWTLVAEGERSFGWLEAWSWSRAPSVISVVTGPPWSEGDLLLPSETEIFPLLPWIEARSSTWVPSREVSVRPPMGFPAGELQRFRPGPTFRCEATGSAVTHTGVTFHRLGAEDSVTVFLEQEVECVPPVSVEVSILDTIPAIRDNLAILTDTAPLPEVRVEARREGTRTVNLAASPWFVIQEPAVAAPPMGPDTITAVNGGATMTATRDPMTGEYASILDDPSVWDPAAITAVTFGGRPSRDVAPVPQFGAVFGPVDGLDTRLTGEGDLRLAIRIEGEVACGAERFIDMVLFRSIVDDLPLDGPLREGLALLATHCEQTIEALTGRPFTVELSRRQSALEIMPDYSARVDVGRAITLSGQDLLRECGGRFSMFCRDRCVDPVGDPMNCGACGRVGVEVCNDMADNDCNYYVDDGCPNRIDWGGGGDADTSGMIGDVVSASDGSIGHGCAYFTPFTGLCGNASSDGTVRGLSAICGSVRLVPTGPDAFDVEVTESYPGGVACEMATFPLGGSPVAARCPRNMIADGVFGTAPSSGNLGQIGVSCSQWDVVRDPALGWVIRRISSGVSPTIGSGPGMPFSSYMVSDHSTLGTPGALRQLRGRYRSAGPAMTPGGVLWFSVAGSPPFLN